MKLSIFLWSYFYLFFSSELSRWDGTYSEKFYGGFLYTNKWTLENAEWTGFLSRKPVLHGPTASNYVCEYGLWVFCFCHLFFVPYTALHWAAHSKETQADPEKGGHVSVGQFKILAGKSVVFVAARGVLLKCFLAGTAFEILAGRGKSSFLWRWWRGRPPRACVSESQSRGEPRDKNSQTQALGRNQLLGSCVHILQNRLCQFLLRKNNEQK